MVSDPANWDRFVAEGSRAIRFLPGPYRRVVERAQPFRASSDYFRTSHPLRVLHALWNTDKHRKITFFAGFGKVLAVTGQGAGRAAYRVTPPIVKNGSEVVRIPIGQVNSKDDFQPVIQVEIALQDGRPSRHPLTGAREAIGGFAGYMHKTVFQVLSDFDDLLHGGPS